MKVIVPLAGPDFELGDGRVKAQLIVEGAPLLLTTLKGRRWYREGQVADGDFAFVLRDSDVTRRFWNEDLRHWFPGAKVAWLSDFTGGAAMTIMAALSLIAHEPGPVCVDLADILYDTQGDPVRRFADEPDLGGLAHVFPSDNPVYSYLAVDAAGDVTRAAEKVVISDAASAGTYWFRDPATLLRAIAHGLDHREELTFRGLFFVCPLYNGVVADGQAVRLDPVGDVRDVKVV